MFPADFPRTSFRRTSVKELHDVVPLKKNDAASSVMSQSSRKRMGQVITGSDS